VTQTHAHTHIDPHLLCPWHPSNNLHTATHCNAQQEFLLSISLTHTHTHTLAASSRTTHYTCSNTHMCVHIFSRRVLSWLLIDRNMPKRNPSRGGGSCNQIMANLQRETYRAATHTRTNTHTLIYTHAHRHTHARGRDCREVIECPFGCQLCSTQVQSGEDAWNALNCRSFSATEPRFLGLFCRKRPIELRHVMGLRHSVVEYIRDSTHSR